MTNNAIIKAGRAMSTVAASHNMAPRAVLSELVSHAFPSYSASRAVAPKSQSRTTIDPVKNIFYSSQEELDPADFGYRVVAPMEQGPHIYTSTDYPGNAKDNYCTTSSTLGRIICNDECAAKEVMAAQKEWDSLIEAEPTRPHFEYWKEDPYAFEAHRAFEAKRSQELFSFIDTHDSDDLEDVAA